MKNQSKTGDADGVMHVTPIDGNVFEDLGFDRQVARAMQEKVVREIEQRNHGKPVMVDGHEQ